MATTNRRLQADPFSATGFRNLSVSDLGSQTQPFGHGGSGVASAAGGERSGVARGRPARPARKWRNEPSQLSAADNSPLGQGTGTPSKQFEGAQSPQVTIEKTAPAEVQVGRPATFQIRVHFRQGCRSQGRDYDELPERSMSTNPQAAKGVPRQLVWSLGTMQPGEEMMRIQVMPVEEGELGSVATVRFQAEATARTRATKPELIVETTAPAQVLVGDPVVLTVTVTNPGTGVASGVVLEERIPAGLQHPAGTELEYDVGELKPNESRQLQLQLTAQRPGVVTNVLVARGDAIQGRTPARYPRAGARWIWPSTGRKRRFLEREAAYTLAISNPGTAAERVELVARLPSGLKFVSANNAGHYNEAEHRSTGSSGRVAHPGDRHRELVTLPVEPGDTKLLVSANAERRSAEREQPVVIEGIAAIMFEVVDVHDPVEKGARRRMRSASSIRAPRPPATCSWSSTCRRNAANAAEGPAPIIHWPPTGLSSRASRAGPCVDTTYRVRVQCLQPGDQRIQAQLTTAEIRDPITKEESTRVYADE